MASATKNEPVKTTSANTKKANKKKTAAKKQTAASTPPTSQLRVQATEAPRVVRAVRPAPTCEQIARRAYQLWERRGRLEGFDREDWLIAEAELYNGL